MHATQHHTTQHNTTESRDTRLTSAALPVAKWAALPVGSPPSGQGRTLLKE